MGGATCAAFSECCSGSCANNQCTTCDSVGQACTDGCCNGLNCYNNQCLACALDNATCTLSSQCCSGICTQGACQACGVPGDACTTSATCCNGYSCVSGACCGASGQKCSADTDCCSGEVCTVGVCGAPKANGAACTKNDDCQSFNCCAGQCSGSLCTNCPANGPTCNEALFQDGSLANQICGVADQDYINFIVCACNATSGPCYSACKDDFCSGLTPSTTCDTCLSTTGATGCGDQENACAAN